LSSSDTCLARSVVGGGGEPLTLVHLTPLEVGSWRRGERFIVRHGEQSFYWRRLFSADRRDSDINAAEAAGAYAEAIGERDYLLACLKELVFESVRTRVDPSLPSRSECMFLFDRELEPSEYGARLGRDTDAHTMVELRPLAGSRLFRARASLLDVPAFVPQIAAAAEAYWRGIAVDAPAGDVEVLFTGAFEIIRVVSAGAGPRITVEGETFADLFRATPTGRAEYHGASARGGRRRLQEGRTQ